MFDCKRCGYDFDYKYLLLRHLKKEKECYPYKSSIDRNILIIELENNSITKLVNDKIKYKCQYCNKLFSSAQSKCNHLKYCKSKDLLITNTTTNSNNSTNTTNSNNTTTTLSNSNNTTNSNNTLIINNGDTNNNFNFLDVNHLNAQLVHHKLTHKIEPFPTYTIHSLFEKRHNKFKEIIHKSKVGDFDPTTKDHSSYSLVLNMFIEILSAEDLRTKNIYINDVKDDIAYVSLDGQFYKINVEELFIIFYMHLPSVIKKIKKQCDEFNGMNKDDKDYVEFSCNRFIEYVNNKSDMTYFKKEILNCIYNNKLILQDLLTHAQPIDKFNSNNNIQQTYRLDDCRINNLRKRFGAKVIDKDMNIIEYDYKSKDKKYRSKNSIEITNNSNNKKYDIKIDYDKSKGKHFATGIVCYKCKYNGFDIWYNDIHEVGTMCSIKSDKLLPVKELCEKINYFIFLISGDSEIDNQEENDNEEIDINNE